MTDRISTGSPRLDWILNGGWLKNAINLVAGVPGSGKTILSQQAVFQNATAERPAVYLTTLYEPLDKILRYGETLAFFDPRMIEDGRVVYHDLGAQHHQCGLRQVLEAIDGILKQTRPGVVVMDGMSSLQTMANEDDTYLEFLTSLLRRLTASATTAILNARFARSEILDQPEAAIADAIVSLDARSAREREVRVLQVLKLRGSAYRSGEHLYRVASSGIEVFPRLADMHPHERYEMAPAHTGTGIPAVDELLGGGGYWAGAATLVAGPSGIGKTLMGLHFLYRGGEAGEAGILATFQENRTQLARIVNSFGWSIDDPNVHVLSRGVVDINIDEWAYDLIELVERVGAKRVVIDSLAELAMSAGDTFRFREWISSLTQRFTRADVSLMMIVEVPDLFQVQRVADNGISHLSDNVVLLQYVQEGAELVRALTVLKTRAMQHEPAVYRYVITKDGFKLGEQIKMTR